MSAALEISRSFREEIARRGGDGAARCMQCATCSTVCDLGKADFPRRQILHAQWGLEGRLLADPAIWLCHQCNDCNARCPRDARPGDAMQAIRSAIIESAGTPKFMAKLVGRAAVTWPLLLGGPVLLWFALIAAVGGFSRSGPLVYAEAVPHWLVDAVFVPAAIFAAAAAWAGARRCWTAWGPRGGALLQGLAAVAGAIVRHERFAVCTVAKPRRLGHAPLVFGFLGAFLTTTAVAIADYGFGMGSPVPQLHPIQLLANLSAILLVAGVAALLADRLASPAMGTSTAFDNFFLALVALLVVTGVGAELARYVLAPAIALAVYAVHLGMVLALFLTFPYSKFAHALYRTLAMAHERLAAERKPS